MNIILSRTCVLPLILVVLLSACAHKTQKETSANDVSALLKRKKICHLAGGEKYDSIRYKGGWDAAYAYNFILPRSFKDSTIDVLDKNGYLTSDTSYLYSTDKHAKIRMWVGETVSFPLGTIGG